MILLGVLGWIGSGQLTNVKAEAENKDKKTNVNEYGSENTQKTNNKEKSTTKVELKKFSYSQIDQSIELQGQTIYNKKIDVKSETTGNIIEINFKRGDRVAKNDELIKISMENRLELLNSSKKNLERLNKELEMFL